MKHIGKRNIAFRFDRNGKNHFTNINNTYLNAPLLISRIKNVQRHKVAYILFFSF